MQGQGLLMIIDVLGIEIEALKREVERLRAEIARLEEARRPLEAKD